MINCSKTPIRRHKINIGKTVVYINPKNQRYGKITKITGFRGVFAKGIPNVTLLDGNSIPANQLAYKIDCISKRIYNRYEFVPMCCGTPLQDDRCKVCGDRYDD